jgi:hypothetical protein
VDNFIFLDPKGQDDEEEHLLEHHEHVDMGPVDDDVPF